MTKDIPSDWTYQMNARQQDVLCSAWRQEKLVTNTQKWSNPPKAVFWHLCCSIYTPMTSREVRTSNSSYTQAALGSVQNILDSSLWNRDSPKPLMYSHHTMWKTTSVPIHLRQRYVLSITWTTKPNTNWRWPCLVLHFSTVKHLSTWELLLTPPSHFKTHIEKTRRNVCSPNYTLIKLIGSRWGARPHTLRSTAFALWYSSAEYTNPVWGRSTHNKRLDPTLNSCCPLIIGCLWSTPTDSLYTLSDLAPPDVRLQVPSMQELERQTTDKKYPMFNHNAAAKRLRSRWSFLRGRVV